MSNKFDFRTAEKLVDFVEKTASTLDIQKGQMETRFGRLHDFFKDEGYDQLACDMSVANKAASEVIVQMHAVSKALSDYAAKLKAATKP